MPAVIERQTIFTPLGIRFWDPATDSQVAHGLRVRAWPDGATAPVRTAFRSASGVYAFQGLPGLREVEYPAASGGGQASPPALERFVLAVEDEQRRFLPVTLRVDAPFLGIYPTGLGGGGSSLPGFYLFSAPWRAASSLAVVRADLVRASTGQPAAHAVLELDVGEGGVWHGIADQRGSVAVFFPIPPFQATLGSSPPGPQAPPQAQQWPVTARLLYQPAHLETPAGAQQPDLRTILTQAAGVLWPTAGGAPASQLSAALSFGQALILRTASLPATQLLVDAT